MFTPNGGQLLSWEQSWFEHTASAIPEPETLLLSGGALVLVGLWGRRRRRSA